MNEKNIEEAPRPYEIRYRRLFETAQNGIMFIDAETGKVTGVNPCMTGMLGYSASEMLGRKLWEIVPPEYAVAARRAFKELQEKEYVHCEDLPVEAKDGRAIEVELVGDAYSVNGEKVIQCSFRDITEWKKLYRQRSDFLAMVTHDFKSPLTTIMGYAELIASDEDLDKNISKMAGSIQKSGEKLLGMVDDFLFHVKLESRVIVPNLAPVDVLEVMTEVEGEFALQAAKKRLTVKVEPEEDLPVFLLDRRLIERALGNLVQNAVNYTPHGGKITIKAGRHSGKDACLAYVSVSDTGPGIPVESRARLFDRYFRSSSANPVRGAGLGLTIVKAVAEAHAGKVELESEVGKGSTFRLVLPAVPRP